MSKHRSVKTSLEWRWYFVREVDLQVNGSKDLRNVSGYLQSWDLIFQICPPDTTMCTLISVGTKGPSGRRRGPGNGGKGNPG